MEATEPMVAHPDAPDEGISRGKGSTPLEEGEPLRRLCPTLS